MIGMLTDELAGMVRSAYGNAHGGDLVEYRVEGGDRARLVESGVYCRVITCKILNVPLLRSWREQITVLSLA